MFKKKEHNIENRLIIVEQVVRDLMKLVGDECDIHTKELNGLKTEVNQLKEQMKYPMYTVTYAPTGGVVSTPSNDVGIHSGIKLSANETYYPALDAYCVKCKEKRGMQEMKIKVSDSGRRMAQGRCAVCGTKMNRILGKTAREQW